MLGCFREHMQFPYSKEFGISAQLILQISKYLEVDPMHIATFDWDGRTAERGSVANSNCLVCFINK